MTTSPHFIDDRNQIATLDKSNMLGSIEALADQVKHGWEVAQSVDFVPTTTIKNVIVPAMGGSGLAADIIHHIFYEKLTVPFEIVNDYHLPLYANENSLVIASSYSGNTEETVQCANEALAKNCQIAFICAGGELEKMASAKNKPLFKMNPVHNPSQQPRMALGYAVTTLLSVLSKAGIIAVGQKEIDEIITTIITTNEQVNVGVFKESNQSKLLAFHMLERRAILVGSDFLSGAVHAGSNQFNENAKYLADFKLIPELNHHLMEGLKFPSSNQDNTTFVFVESSLYPEKIQKRFALTKEVVEQNGIETLSVKLLAESKLTQAFELITIMAYTGFYLSMLENLDPSPIPYVDWFKEQLAS